MSIVTPFTVIVGPGGVIAGLTRNLVILRAVAESSPPIAAPPAASFCAQSQGPVPAQCPARVVVTLRAVAGSSPQPQVLPED